jgi:hypothetical protein
LVFLNEVGQNWALHVAAWAGEMGAYAGTGMVRMKGGRGARRDGGAEVRAAESAARGILEAGQRRRWRVGIAGGGAGAALRDGERMRWSGRKVGWHTRRRCWRFGDCEVSGGTMVLSRLSSAPLAFIVESTHLAVD